MTADVLLSGFLGALIGGVVVALSDWGLQRRQNRRDEYAAARLVCMEMSQNYYHVENLKAFALDGKAEICQDLYSERAWHQLQVRLASLLPSEDLNLVYRAYMRPPAIFKAVVPLGSAGLVQVFFARPESEPFVAAAKGDIRDAVRCLDRRLWRRPMRPLRPPRPSLVSAFYAHLDVAREANA